MSKHKNTSTYLIFLRLFIVVALVGLILLLYNGLSTHPSQTVFTLIVFVMSVSALVMTTLQSVSGVRQLELTRRAARQVEEASERIRILTSEEKALTREVRKDVHLDEEILAILQEFELEEEHKKVVAQRLTSYVNTKAQSKD